MFLKKILKKYFLRSIKKWNSHHRKKIGKKFKNQFDLEWGIEPVPEWFDHYIDLYYIWGLNNQNVFWVERGAYNLLAIKESSTMLELCCGDGFNSKYFYSHKAKSIIAVDFDPNAIEHAKKYNQANNVVFKDCDIRSVIPEGSFDNIIWDAAIEHFTEDEIATIMMNIKDRLNKDGILSGYTIIEKTNGKQHSLHEYEFKSKEDLKRFIEPYFNNVMIFETQYPNRHNLYFYASDSIIPFTDSWQYGLVSSKGK